LGSGPSQFAEKLWFWVAQRFSAAVKCSILNRGFTGCRKIKKGVDRRGRAALQGRGSRVESIAALAPVVVFDPVKDFFRSLFSR